VTLTKKSRLAADTQLLAGLAKHLGADGTLSFDGKRYKLAELEGIFQRRIDLSNEVAAMKGALAKALVDERAGMDASDPLVLNIRRVLKAMFAFSPDILAELGLQPPARRVPTVETKTNAIAKRLATRAARHTMGHRQREKIHGQVADPALEDGLHSTEEATVTIGPHTVSVTSLCAHRSDGPPGLGWAWRSASSLLPERQQETSPQARTG
jgi:hypothetical protein